LPSTTSLRGGGPRRGRARVFVRELRGCNRSAWDKRRRCLRVAGGVCGGAHVPVLRDGRGGCSCVTNSGPGGNCGQYGPVEFPSCLSGLACVPPPEGAPNSCMSPANLGNACTSLFQCGAQYLASDTICDETHTHACIAKPSSGSCVVVYGMNTCDPVVSYCDGSTGPACRGCRSASHVTRPPMELIRAGPGTPVRGSCALRGDVHARLTSRRRA